MKKTLLLFLSLTLLNGCASIVGNSSYPVTISSNPNNAHFVVVNEEGKEVHNGITPSTVTLESSAGYFDGEKYSITYEKEGYYDGLSEINSRISGWYFGNLLFGLSSVLGLLIIDPATGAMWSLPRETTATLVQN